MNSAIVALILSGLSRAALAIIGKLLTDKFFTEILEKLIIAGIEKVGEETNSPLINEIAKVVKKNLQPVEKIPNDE